MSHSKVRHNLNLQMGGPSVVEAATPRPGLRRWHGHELSSRLRKAPAAETAAGPQPTPASATGSAQQMTLRQEQLVVFGTLYVAYAVLSMSRRCVPVVGSDLIDSLGFDKAELGGFGSAFLAAYGVSKLAGGIATDLLADEMVLCGALVCTGAFALLLTTSSSYGWMAALWFAAGLAQGPAWPALANILMRWFQPTSIGSMWGLLSTATNVGVSFGPMLLVLVLTSTGRWTAVFRVTGCALLLVGAAAFAILIRARRRLPEVKGEDGGEDGEKEGGEMQEQEGAGGGERTGDKATAGDRRSLSRIFWEDVLFTHSFIGMCLANATVVFLVSVLSDWSNMFMHESFELSKLDATQCLFWLEIGGIIGTIGSGMVSDRLGGRRTLTSALFSVVFIPCFAILRALPKGTPLAILCSLLAACGVSVHAGRTLCGIDLRERFPRVKGTATSVIGMVGQVGGMLSGFPMGYLAQHYGWDSVFVCTLAIGVLSFAIYVALLPTEPVVVERRRRENAQALAVLSRGRGDDMGSTGIVPHAHAHAHVHANGHSNGRPSNPASPPAPAPAPAESKKRR